ncbi:MAG: CoA transferase, partial [Chloroflexi bacterium]|nr:CoA transferase [Chloroflexota bacterium]
AYFGAMLHGVGQEVDVSMHEALLSGADNRLVAYDYSKTSPHRGDSAGAGYVDCADGAIQFPVTGGNARMWNRMVTLLERPELRTDERFLTPLLRSQNNVELGEIVIPWLMSQNRRDIASAAQALGLAATPVLDIGEVMDDPHHNARGFFVEADQPAAGKLRYPGAPFKLQEGAWEMRRPAPMLGQHNEDVYCGQLGYSPAEVERLRGLGVI